MGRRCEVLTTIMTVNSVVLAPWESDFASDSLSERSLRPCHEHVDLARGLAEEPSVRLVIDRGAEVKNTDRWAVVVPSSDSSDLPRGVILVYRLIHVSDRKHSFRYIVQSCLVQRKPNLISHDRNDARTLSTRMRVQACT